MSAEYLALYLGAVRAGIMVAPLAPSSTPVQLVAMATDAGARLFFVDRAVATALGEANRGDDAVGVTIAEALMDCVSDDVTVRCVHQLGPELAGDLAFADQVIRR